MKLYGGRYRWQRRPRIESAIAVACAGCALSLAVWQTLLLAFLLAHRRPWSDIYSQIADADSSIHSAWTLTALASLAVGISVFTVAIVWLRAPNPSISTVDRARAWLQAAASFCVTSFYLGLQLRIISVALFVGGVALPFTVDGPLVEEHEYEVLAPEYSFYLTASVLVLVYALLQARASLRGMLRARRAVPAILAIALGVIGSTLFLGLPRAGMHISPFGYVSHNRLSEEDEAVLRGDPSTSEVFRTYWSTFGPFDKPARDLEMRLAARRRAEGSPCRVCVLPRTPFLSLRGLPILLDRRPPNESKPGLTVELLGYGDEYRVYAPQQNVSTDVKPIDELGADLSGSQWVLLKANAHATVDRFGSVLNTFNRRGVRRVTLAGYPVGTTGIPKSPSLLTFGDCSGCKPYWEAPPPPGMVHRTRRIMIVRTYVPPDSQPAPPKRCDSYSASDLHRRSLGPSFHQADTLPARISITSNFDVQDVVNLYSRAWYGGAQEICLNPAEASRSVE